MNETLDYIKGQIKDFVPETALVLGSGSGDFASNLNGIEIPYSDIPNFKTSSVQGHNGSLLFCNFEGKNIVIAKGRVHFYEGYDIKDVVYYIKIFKKLGVKNLVLTNAAGTCNKKIKPPSLVLIKDHINFTGVNPLIGKNDEDLGPRFPDMSEIYSKELISLCKKCAKKLKIDLKEGVYLGLTGPSYETPAEIKAYKKLGADLIGMSTVNEAIYANYMGIKVLGLSTATNYCSGISKTPLNHKEVLEMGKIVTNKSIELLKEFVKNI